MARKKDPNYVSIWFWMFAMFVTCVPIIGWIMIVVWAYSGENESRKNYFKAILAWLVTIVLLLGGLALYSQEDFQDLMRMVWTRETQKQVEPAGPPGAPASAGPAARPRQPEPPKPAQTPKSPARGTTTPNR